jgi:hypothetical protein
MSDLPNDPILERWTDLVRRFDVMEQQLDELSRLLERYTEMTRMMLRGEAPPPPPSVN